MSKGKKSETVDVSPCTTNRYCTRFFWTQIFALAGVWIMCSGSWQKLKLMNYKWEEAEAYWFVFITCILVSICLIVASVYMWKIANQVSGIRRLRSPSM